MKTYEATAQLWRPEAEMKMGLMRLVSLVQAAVVVVIYATMVRPKSVGAGLIYGCSLDWDRDLPWAMDLCGHARPAASGSELVSWHSGRDGGWRAARWMAGAGPGSGPARKRLI